MEVSDTYPQTHTLSRLFSQAVVKRSTAVREKRAAAKRTHVFITAAVKRVHTAGGWGDVLLIKYGTNTAVLNCTVSHLREFPL